MPCRDSNSASKECKLPLASASPSIMVESSISIKDQLPNPKAQLPRAKGLSISNQHSTILNHQPPATSHQINPDSDSTYSPTVPGDGGGWFRFPVEARRGCQPKFGRARRS